MSTWGHWELRAAYVQKVLGDMEEIKKTQIRPLHMNTGVFGMMFTG